MLFILSGDIQTGKTRWLERLETQLVMRGVSCYGVIAPGNWIKSDSALADKNGYEKLGIYNKLLPSHEYIEFAVRDDIAKNAKRYDSGSQAAANNLRWHISEEALAAVNEHLVSIQSLMKNDPGPKILIIDELGRLEIEYDGGLTEALHMLALGSNTIIPHALIVVRKGLLEKALKKIGETWLDYAVISPDEEALELIIDTLMLGR